MSQWGVFPVEIRIAGKPTAHSLHVAPTGTDRDLLAPHVLERSCPCSPKLEHSPSGKPIWIHQDRERGGGNA